MVQDSNRAAEPWLATYKEKLGSAGSKDLSERTRPTRLGDYQVVYLKERGLGND